MFKIIFYIIGILGIFLISIIIYNKKNKSIFLLVLSTYITIFTIIQWSIPWEKL